jgi:hypothetical protein
MKNIQIELLKGRTISQYPTGDNYGYSSYYRWDDTKEVVNSKSIIALNRKNILLNLPISNTIIK